MLDALDWSKDSFLDAVIKGAFTVPGDGSIDFAKVLEQSKDNPVFYVQYANARINSVMRKAREAGQIEVLELDEGMFQWGLKAAAFRLPFLRSSQSRELPHHHARQRIRCGPA